MEDFQIGICHWEHVIRRIFLDDMTGQEVFGSPGDFQVRKKIGEHIRV